MKNTLLVLITISLFVSACGPQAAAPVNIPILPTIIPSSTNTFVSEATQTLTPLPTATATPIPHPMSIIGMRAGDYPGSEITIVKELDRGLNYRRYYTYYLSEGLKIYALFRSPIGQMPEGGFPARVFIHVYIPPNVYKTTERYIA